MPLNPVLLFFASLSWASGYLFIGWADAALPPITVTAGQAATGALALLPVVLATGRPLVATLRRRPWVPLVMGATAMGVPNLTTVIAEERIAADMASLVGTTVPILTFLLAVFVTREVAPRLRKFAGVFVAFGGLLIFVGPGDLGAESTELWAALIMMSGGAVFAFNGILAAEKAHDLESLSLSFWVLLFAALGLAAVAGAVEGPQLSWPGLPALASLAGSGAIGTGAGFAFYYLLIDRAGAAYASNYAYLVPPLGLLLGVIFQGESLTLLHVGGVAVTLIGLWLLAGGGKGKPAAVQTQHEK
jgi:drug/metabolite transporter (DMT)-like permease